MCDLAERLQNLTFGDRFSQSLARVTLPNSLQILTFWRSLRPEFGSRDLARYFEDVVLQWCSGQLFAMRECKRMSCGEKGGVACFASGVTVRRLMLNS